MAGKKILAINPGSTSTKIAVYDMHDVVLIRKIEHSAKELEQFACIMEQFEFRRNVILDTLSRAGIDLQKINIVIGRGGILKPLQSGVYAINDQMLKDIKSPRGEHVSNLGIILANEIAGMITPRPLAITADPTCVDEMEEVARISGMPELPRLSMLHTLNQKAVARRYARKINKVYEQLNLIVAHMGGGISVGAHKQGRIVDVNNALHGDGPFSPERSGGVPAGQLVELCFSGHYSKEEVMKKIVGQGGLVGYLKTNNFAEVSERVKAGDAQAMLYYQAMAYQVAKEIGAMGTVLSGKIDAIILTGGLANDTDFNKLIISRVEHIAPVIVYPGEDEMKAMAINAWMVLNQSIEIKEYI